MTMDRTAPPKDLVPAGKVKTWMSQIIESSVTVSVVAILSILLILVMIGTILVRNGLTDAPSNISRALQDSQGNGADVANHTDGFTLAPEEIRPLTVTDARAFNDAIPFSGLPIQAAKPFVMAPDRLDEYSRALDCMTAAIYYEAASETTEGKAAVAQVIINRMRHPAYPHSICGVVFQGSDRATGCQFSFTCDGAMTRTPSVQGWTASRAVATAALNGFVARNVGMATHYHTNWVAPYWAERLVKMRQINTHIFYRWAGSWGLPAAFNARPAATEPIIAKMAGLNTTLALVEPALPETLTVPDKTQEQTLIATLPRLTTDEDNRTVRTDVEQPIALPVVEEQPAPPTAPVLVNPLTPPTEMRERQRPRIPVPSTW